MDLIQSFTANQKLDIRMQMSSLTIFITICRCSHTSELNDTVNTDKAFSKYKKEEKEE